MRYKEAKIREYWWKEPGSARRPLLLEKLYPYVFENPARERAYLREFFAVKPPGPGDPYFSHKIRWDNSSKNLGFLSDACRDELAGYDPFPELTRLLPEGFSERDILSRAQVLEMEIFLSNFLLSSQGDRVGMAHSVEMRHPFLDFRVIDFAFRLPARWKIRGLNEKYLLKAAFRGRIPERITARAKQPYRAPIRELFFPGALPDYVDDLLSQHRLEEYGYFHPTKVSRLYNRFRSSDKSAAGEFQNMALIGVLTTQILHQQYVMGLAPRAAARLVPDRVVSAAAGSRS